MILYNLRSTATGFRIAKFDEFMDVEAVYNLTPTGKVGQPFACDCPASQRPSCKHRKMVNRFVLANKQDTDEFYCYETQTWHRPIKTFDEGDATAEKAAAIAAAAGSCCGPTETCDCYSMDECDERQGCQLKAASGHAVEPSPLPEIESDTNPDPTRRTPQAERQQPPAPPVSGLVIRRR